MSKSITSLKKNSHSKMSKNTTMKKKDFKVAPDSLSDNSLCLHTTWELAKHSQETQDDLMNLGELRREICLPKQMPDIQK